MLYTPPFLQRQRQWNKSDIQLIPGKVTAHECNKRIVTRQNPNANVQRFSGKLHLKYNVQCHHVRNCPIRFLWSCVGRVIVADDAAISQATALHYCCEDFKPRVYRYSYSAVLYRETARLTVEVWT